MGDFILHGGNNMIEIAYLREKENLRTMQQEVQETIKGTLQVLDSEYGEYRNYKEYGGYVIVVENEDDFKEIKDKTYIDCNNVIVEFVDKITCSDGEIFTSSLTCSRR